MALRSLKDMVGSVFCRGCSHHTGSTSDLAQKSIRNSVNTAKAQAGECAGVLWRLQVFNICDNA